MGKTKGDHCSLSRENFERGRARAREKTREKKPLHKFPKPGRKGRARISRHLYQQNGTNPEAAVQHLMQQTVQKLMQGVQHEF